MSEADDTLIGVPLFQEAQKCAVCGKVKRCSHRVGHRPACDPCFAGWARAEFAKLEGYEKDTPWLIKTMHNMIFGPFSTNAIQKWLREGLLSYTVEVSRPHHSQWVPVTQEDMFEDSAKEGRRAMHGDSEPATPIQSRARRITAALPIRIETKRHLFLGVIAIIGLALGLTISLRLSKRQSLEPTADDLKRRLEGMSSEQQEMEIHRMSLQFLSSLQKRQFLVAASYLEQMERYEQMPVHKILMWRSQVYRLSESPKLDQTLPDLQSAYQKMEESSVLKDHMGNELALAYVARKQDSKARLIWEQLAVHAKANRIKEASQINLDILSHRQSDETGFGTNGKSEPYTYIESLVTQKSTRPQFWQPYHRVVGHLAAAEHWEAAGLLNREAMRLFPLIPHFILHNLRIRNSLHTEKTTDADDTVTRMFAIEPDALDWIWESPLIIPDPRPYTTLSRQWTRADLKVTPEIKNWFAQALTSLDEPYSGLPQELLRASKMSPTESKEYKGFFCWFAYTFSSEGVLSAPCRQLSDARVFVILGKTYIKDQNFQDALNMAERVLMMEPQNPWGAWIKAKSYFALNRVTEADGLVQKFLEIYPTFYPLVELLLEEGFNPREFL